MDESSFDIDSQQLAATSRRFPAHRLERTEASPDSDVSYLVDTPGAEFGRHVLEEGGRR